MCTYTYAYIGCSKKEHFLDMDNDHMKVSGRT